MEALTIRKATRDDLLTIVNLLADDELGATREDARAPLDPRYAEAFDAIESDHNHLLVVAESNAQVVGCLQISFLPGLSRKGMWRGHIEGVRVARSLRGSGLGRQLIEWAVERCRERGCGLVQLTTDKSRPSAHRFYEELGFVASHEGMKRTL